MKMLILLLAAAGLSGCAVYPDGDYQNYGAGYGQAYPSYPSPAVYSSYPGYPSYNYPYGYGTVQPPVVVQPPPVYIYGSGVYRNGYRRPYPYARPDTRPDTRPGARPPGHAQGYDHGDRRPWPQRQEAHPDGTRPGNPWSNANRTPPQPRGDSGPVRRLQENGWGDPGRR